MANEKIMIVEDEYIVGREMQSFLSDMGFTVHQPIASGEEALRMAEVHQPDIILMDIYLAGEMDGVEAAGRIHEHLGIPIIFLTAYSDQAIIDRARLAEPFGYLLKPFEDQELKVAIEVALYKDKMEKKLRESELRYRTVADFTYDWEFWIKPDKSIEYVSPSCERITGYTPEKFMENPDLMHRIIHMEDLDVYFNHLVLHEKREAGPSIDFRIIDKTGQTHWINHMCQPVFDVQGNYLGIRGSNRDITDRKETEENNKRLIKELRNAKNEIKELRGFLPICSHCKNIRDDEGYWHRIDMYIQDHSEAKFSHSICPDCARKLYPDLFEK